MIKEAVILGAAGIVIGIVMILKDKNILVSLIPIIIGLALIFFHKEENKIEKRKDKK